MSPCVSRMIDVDAAGIDVSIIAFADEKERKYNFYVSSVE